MPPKILCIIPARSGSKAIPGKNVKLFRGKPLLVWSIEQALSCKYPLRVIVSTDSEEYATIARGAGAEVPFLRPAEISQDGSIDEELFVHALKWLQENEKYAPEILVHLRPTYPTRSVETLNRCIEKFLEVRDRYDSLRTVVPCEKTPYKMYRFYPEENRIEPLFRSLEGVHEPFNNCRQNLPPTVAHNFSIDILKGSLPLKGTMSGERIYPFFMSATDFFDIDTPEDWEAAEKAAI